MEKIFFDPGDGEGAEFYVLEQTRIGGADYILVTDAEDGDGEAMILRDMSQPGETEAVYEIVEDDDELKAVAGVFGDMLEDVELS